jgi:hypothetical protein
MIQFNLLNIKCNSKGLILVFKVKSLILIFKAEILLIYILFRLFLV